MNLSPSSRESLTARLEGAETEARTTMLAANAFWAISNPVLPLISRMCQLTGNWSWSSNRFL